MSSVDNLIFAGKCGSLLIKLSADATETLTAIKVKAHARLCGIGQYEVPIYLETLKAHGCLDCNKEHTTYEVLSHSRQRVLETTAAILGGNALSKIENCLPDLLEFCLQRPRLEGEVRKFLLLQLEDRDTEQELGLIAAFDLLGVVDVPGRAERLFFNGYQFGNKAIDIGKALAALIPAERSELNELLEQVSRKPGTPPEMLLASQKMKDMAVGLGLVEVSTVSSPGGTAQFFTPPRFAPPSVGHQTEHLEDDVFHHAKMLLSSLRFGEYRSKPSRGKLISPAMLANALLSRDRIGPCTAIGQDYVLLEGEGVVKTVPAKLKSGNQFYMELRRREPAEIVLGLLESGAGESIDSKVLKNLELPLHYTGPELARPAAVKAVGSKDPHTLSKFLEELRT